jgi:Creatinase/Prolidase N-terminal domain
MTTGARARLGDIELPVFSTPESMPTIPVPLYSERLERLRERSAARGYDRTIIYADREHSANLSYLTGFDPRFEEALLIVGPVGEPLILVGNECAGMAREAPLPMKVELFQELSLPSQPRNRSSDLGALLKEAGVISGTRVGMVGWKGLGSERIDVPSFIVDGVRSASGDTGSVENATDLFNDPADGLRVINEIEQIVAFEYASCHTSNGVRNLIFELEPGITEQEAVRFLEWNGSPLSCHLMLTAGDRARLGLLSPADRRIERGDPFTVAYGIWGALNCRAGFVAEDAGDLADDIGDYVERLVAPYFEAVAEWYQALHIGQSGGALQEIIDRQLGDPFFGIFLNPGHQLHLDEWVNSPVWPGSKVELRSGMVLQVDIIPATGTRWFTSNIEDGIALADESLRMQVSNDYPRVWERMMARRQFMKDALGIDLHPDVLPLSNIAGFLPPFLLRPERAMTLA